MLDLKKPEFVDEIKHGIWLGENENFWFYRGFRVPKHFGWWIVLMELSKMRNVELEIVYSGGRIRNKPDQFTMDEKNCIAPEMPLIVKVYRVKRERVKHDYEDLFGRTYRKKREKAVTLKNLEGFDPNPIESLNMIKAMLEM